MTGYRTQQRMSCFSALPRTALSRGHALVCDFFSPHFYSLSLFFLILSHCNTTLFLIQLDKPKRRPWCFMCVVSGSPWMAHQRLVHMFLYAFNRYSWFTTVCVQEKTEIGCSRQIERCPVFFPASFYHHSHTQSLPFHNFSCLP